MRILTAVLLSTATLAAISDQKLGKGVELAEATPIKALYETPDKFVGKTIRVDGIVTAVCEEMGCWMALGADAKAEQVVRFKVGHDAGITFPVSARGKAASAEGVFEKIAADDKEANNAASEHAAHGAAAAFGKLYQIKASGAVIK
jgi:Domain of unknown function (DUF4920)